MYHYIIQNTFKYMLFISFVKGTRVQKILKVAYYNYFNLFFFSLRKFRYVRDRRTIRKLTVAQKKYQIQYSNY